MMKMRWFALLLFLLPLALTALDLAEYGVAEKPWPEHYGNHRAVVSVDQARTAFSVVIPWRLKFSPASKGLIVVEAATGQEISKINRRRFSSDSGQVAFRSNESGLYYIYYLPYEPDPSWAGFKGRYARRNSSNFFPLRKKKRAAKLVRLESRTQLDSFYPMEVCPTAKEKQDFLQTVKGQEYLVFTENRRNQVRMKRELPYHWVQSGEKVSLIDDAARNEWYPVQIALYASAKDIQNVQLSYSGLKGPGSAFISADAFTCINLEGVDPWGEAFTKRVDVKRGGVQPFWIGIDIPADAVPGEYRGEVLIQSDQAADRTVSLQLNVTDEFLADRGDGQLWRLSRLRWLNSRAGLDDSQMIAPFVPVKKSESGDAFRFDILNRSITIGANGLPASIKVGGEEILSAPMLLGGKADAIELSSIRLTRQESFAVDWEWEGKLDGLTLNGAATLEADGYLNFTIELSASKGAQEGAVRLQIPLVEEKSRYIMGFNGGGRERPDKLRAAWSGPRDSFWIGNPDSGLYVEMQGASYTGPMLNLYHPEYPDAWYNGGAGDYGLFVNGAEARVDLNSGSRLLNAGESVRYEFAMIVTPVKEIDWQAHFDSRYFHMTPMKEFVLFKRDKYGKPSTVSEEMLQVNSPMPWDEDIKKGINIVNIHHALAENPYINYPFATPDRIKSFVKEAHGKGLKVKLYYTVRELTQAVYEIWALRSLGDEIFPYGKGGGYIWLQEHLEDDYIPAWYSHNGDELAPDAAMVTSGITRWYNYYVEGLRWMVQNYGIDGVYMDDVAFDRTILKRMRRVMEDVKPGCLIDLHSNTGFSKGPAIQYTEFFPYVDRLWFGESFHYNEMSEAAFLVESSGIPFGLTGDMLSGGGNPWRGMLYGMTNRYPWFTEQEVSDPRPVHALWDRINIREATWMPYWDEALPVRSGDEDVKTTVYRSPDGKKLLIVVASFAAGEREVVLDTDWDALGLDPARCRFTLPAIGNLQDEQAWSAEGMLKLAPAGGAMILVESE